MSLGEVTAQIERVCAMTDQARQAIVLADEMLDETTHLLTDVLTGSS